MRYDRVGAHSLLDGEVANTDGPNLTGIEELLHPSPDLIDGDIKKLDLSVREGQRGESVLVNIWR